MKYCVNCNFELADNATLCPKCGTLQPVDLEIKKTEPEYEPVPTEYEDADPIKKPYDIVTPMGPHHIEKGATLWFVIGLIIPVLGIILYLRNQVDRPGAANQALKGAYIGAIISTIFMVMGILFY